MLKFNNKALLVILVIVVGLFVVGCKDGEDVDFSEEDLQEGIVEEELIEDEDFEDEGLAEEIEKIEQQETDDDLEFNPAGELGMIGYVDLARVYQAYPQVEEIERELQAEVETLEEEFYQQVSELGEDEHEEAQQLQQEVQQEIFTLQKEQEEQLEATIDPILTEAREELGLEIIITEEGVVAGTQDITEKIINRL
ncbi:hypothetical protein [Natroniella sp. ANB-PHB2]|uniref:hypothetical protein n=1 Tax=Natroniella sp. ANB-PHB2 TaxID=3384444 RepID=UPI0038D3DCD6